MSTFASVANATTDVFWWQGSLTKIEARAKDTDGALGLAEGNVQEYDPEASEALATTFGFDVVGPQLT